MTDTTTNGTTEPMSESTPERAHRTSWNIVLDGILLVLLAAVVILSPEKTERTFIWFIGILSLIGGAVLFARIWSVSRMRTLHPMYWGVALVPIGVGLILLVWPLDRPGDHGLHRGDHIAGSRHRRMHACHIEQGTDPAGSSCSSTDSRHRPGHPVLHLADVRPGPADSLPRRRPDRPSANQVSYTTHLEKANQGIRHQLTMFTRRRSPRADPPPAASRNPAGTCTRFAASICPAARCTRPIRACNS